MTDRLAVEPHRDLALAEHARLSPHLDLMIALDDLTGLEDPDLLHAPFVGGGLEAR